ncbi:DUF4360 domain-containing protein [Actinoallomurus spadix]|uniref:DUF4360 domain-containing protein n=1 Tax=Actinoallomurus spadix TaxID=79912 RepID=A0ABP3FZK2_9ACTN|nr:DUF4360 domain-containing protein [Actinoallomurus spadix]MCO5989170.1 DUF4360 domain-containing protein [Actinoallomurus spadix]
MLKNLTIVGAAAAFLIASAPAAAATDTAPPTDRITVDVKTVNGSGCPRGTAAVTELADNTGFTVTYSDYLAEVGPAAAPTDFRKNCQISVLVHAPQGFTYAIAEADYRGHAHLEGGAAGLQQASYYFQGDSETLPVGHTLSGPYDGDWATTDKADVATLVYKPCGEDRILNINTELRVSADGADAKKTSYLSMNTTRGAVNSLYRLRWKQCP